MRRRRPPPPLAALVALTDRRRRRRRRRFSDSDIAYLQTLLPHALHARKETAAGPQSFFDWLRQLTTRDVRVFAVEHGAVVFPRIPLLRIEGPLAVTQLLETGLLNLVNYPSLVATNAARMRSAVGPDKVLLEFGLRRAQGPDGGISASKYAYVGGFDATSNVLAGKLFDIAVRGTHAHAFVMSYAGLGDLHTPRLDSAAGDSVDFLARCLFYRARLGYEDTNEGELAAFVAYAQAFPRGFLALIDTYDSLQSGARNFVVVALALVELGYAPLGVRLDSGDLAYISRQVRALFRRVDAELRDVLGGRDVFARCSIVASNDLDEEVLLSLQTPRRGSLGAAPDAPSDAVAGAEPPLRPHEIDVFGVGTSLVTCRGDPALGCVYKLVELSGAPRIKVSQDVDKLVIPSRKRVFRLFGREGWPLVDVMRVATEPPPVAGVKLLVKHPFRENVEAYVMPTRVEELLRLVYDGPALAAAAASDAAAGAAAVAQAIAPHCDLREARARCMRQLSTLREDHVRPVNPTPYKVSVSADLYDALRALLRREKKETVLS